MFERPDYNRMEKRKAEKEGAKVVPNSGRGYRKGDAEYLQYLIDWKFTEGKSFALNLDKFRKHEMDAFKVNRVGIYVVEFLGRNFEANYAICDWNYFRDLM